jgi:hypothetical protein
MKNPGHALFYTGRFFYTAVLYRNFTMAPTKRRFLLLMKMLILWMFSQN